MGLHFFIFHLQIHDWVEHLCIQQVLRGGGRGGGIGGGQQAISGDRRMGRGNSHW